MGESSQVTVEPASPALADSLPLNHQGRLVVEFLRELNMSFNQGALDLTTDLGLETGGEILILSVVTSVRFLGTRPHAFPVVKIEQFFSRLSIYSIPRCAIPFSCCFGQGSLEKQNQ